MTRKCEQWDEADKRKAVAAYVLTRNVAKSARLCGIPRRTIQQWKDSHPDWWDRVAQEVWAEQEEHMQAGCKEVIDLAFTGLLDRLKNGDVVMVQGEERRIPPKSLELAKVMGITMDKLSLLRGKPTSISARQEDTTRDRLEELKSIVGDKKVVGIGR
jgi:hypothetical protein